MKKILSSLLIFVFCSSGVLGATFFEEVERKLEQGKLEQFLKSVKAPLYSNDGDDYGPQLKRLEKATKNLTQEGDILFPFMIYSDLVTGKNHRGKIAGDVQEDSLEVMLDFLGQETKNISNKELAIYYLGEVATANEIRDNDFREESVNALVKAAKAENLVLLNATLIKLKKVAIKGADEWESLAEEAAEKMASFLDNDNLEARRIAYLEIIDALHQAQAKTDATELLWEKLSDSVEDITSPGLQNLVKKKLTDLITERKGSSFDLQARAADKSLNELESLKENPSDTWQELLEDLKDEKSAQKYENMISKIEDDIQNSLDLQFSVFSRISEYASTPAISSYKLRIYCDTLIDLTFKAATPVAFYRTSATLLGLTAIHQNSDKANIPLIALGNLLNSTNNALLITPVMEEMVNLSRVLPLWIERRMNTMIFVQAGDSENPLINRSAFKLLTEIGKKAPKKAMRWEINSRMKLLAKYAKSAQIKKLAQNWK